MRFDFEANVIFFIKLDDTGVILKHAHTPIVIAQRFANGLRGRKDGFFEHVVVLSLVRFGRSIGVRSAIVNASRKRLVTAVLGPSLRDRLQFDVSRIATDRNKVIANRLHLDQRQIKLSVFGKPFQRWVVETANGDGHELEITGRSDVQLIKLKWPKHDLFDRVV